MLLNSGFQMHQFGLRCTIEFNVVVVSAPILLKSSGYTHTRRKLLLIYKGVLNISHESALNENSLPINTYKWCVRVEGLEAIIQKVEFQLHPNISNPIRDIVKPPFYITEENGTGGFLVNIKVFFKNNKVELLKYDLYLRSVRYKVRNTVQKRILFKDPSEDLIIAADLVLLENIANNEDIIEIEDDEDNSTVTFGNITGHVKNCSIHHQGLYLFVSTNQKRFIMNINSGSIIYEKIELIGVEKSLFSQQQILIAILSINFQISILSIENDTVTLLWDLPGLYPLRGSIVEQYRQDFIWCNKSSTLVTGNITGDLKIIFGSQLRSKNLKCEISKVAVTNNDHKILIGCRSGMIKLLQSDFSQPDLSIKESLGKEICQLSISEDGSIGAAGTAESEVVLFNMSDISVIHSVKVPCSCVFEEHFNLNKMEFLNGWLIIATDCGSVIFNNIVENMFHHHSYKVFGNTSEIALHCKGNKIFLKDIDGTRIMCHQLTSGIFENYFSGSNTRISCIALSRCYLATASEGTVKLFSL